MRRHPHFDLWLHDDGELASLLGGALTERVTLHEWPLSCVQRLRTIDGRAMIYKSQARPTVEPSFYAHARSPLLVNVRTLDVPDGPAALLLDHVDGPRLSHLRPDEEVALRVGWELRAGISRIAGELPVFADVSTEERWLGYARAMLEDLAALVESGVFRRVDQTLVDRLTRRAESGPVLAAVRLETGYAHGDLSADNVFVAQEGYRIIDWQRPIWGPVDLDLAILLESLGLDARRHVADGTAQLSYLLRIAWFAQCARRWFPRGAASYDAEISRLARRLEKADSTGRGSSSSWQPGA